ncbi:GMC family oxidoreductase [Rubinisphaera sp.]|uniref:GMC oxidoreductase n=1 Tax=Rubinisphaera sp. TaxID=2024857 RepID=UPI000C0CB898|nr:GMC family oxidoreductase [Rubinisphaera sp.]MBV08673.1 hypothetical protein [Rubinisphaera sp.]
MICDARDPTVSLNRTADVAIVGGGPVGLLVAERLAKLCDVVVLESGGRHDEQPADKLNVARVVPDSYPINETRTRRLGGSTALWAGYLTPVDSSDLEVRDWIDGSGWPIKWSELQHHFDRILGRFHLPKGDFESLFNTSALASGCGIDLPFDPRLFRWRTWRFGTPIWRFGRADEARLDASNTPIILTHANVIDLRLSNDHGRIDGVVVRTICGREGRLKANLVVIACGGLETPRLLLNCDSQQPWGIGNQHGLVGRFFMEHPHHTLSAIEVQNSSILSFSASRVCVSGRSDLSFNFGPTNEFQKASRLLNAGLHAFRTPAMSEGQPPRIGAYMEQVPNPESRVKLSTEVDAVGMRGINLEWKLLEEDWRSVESIQEKLLAEFEREGLGRLARGAAPLREGHVLHSNHHLGTTRMAATPEEGVVNANCQIHGIENGYLIGGNVFPTGGWANPSLTLLALASRLADHLVSKLEGQLWTHDSTKRKH